MLASVSWLCYNCADGYKEWNTHCGDSIVDVNHDDHRRFMTLVSQNVEEVSSNHCGLCQRSGADHDLAAEQVEQIDARQTDLEAIQAEIGDLENLEPPFTDEEASRFVTLRCELEQCNEQILGLENRQSELECNAKNSHTALV